MDDRLFWPVYEAMTRHDLKGPLAGALGIVQAQMESRDIDKRHADQLRIAEQAMLQVVDMINMSTELFKIETGRFTLKQVPLPIGDMLRRVVETARAAFAYKQLTIAVDADGEVGKDPVRALGDALLTYSLLTNLFKNACEAAPDGSRVDARLGADAPLRIDISNDGVIPPAIRAHFFDKFSTAGKTNGTGLGTYSARLLARAQHGEVTFEVSDEANRTSLIVTLPAAPPA